MDSQEVPSPMARPSHFLYAAEVKKKVVVVVVADASRRESQGQRLAPRKGTSPQMALLQEGASC